MLKRRPNILLKDELHRLQAELGDERYHKDTD